VMKTVYYQGRGVGETFTKVILLISLDIPTSCV
jgi:hypothetical protein